MTNPKQPSDSVSVKYKLDEQSALTAKELNKEVFKRSVKADAAILRSHAKKSRS